VRQENKSPGYGFYCSFKQAEGQGFYDAGVVGLREVGAGLKPVLQLEKGNFVLVHIFINIMRKFSYARFFGYASE
jgi:hypothetical protein